MGRSRESIERRQAALRQRYRDDPEYRAKVQAANHESYLRNRENALDYVKRWQKANPEKVAASRAAYHQRARASGVYRAGHIRRRYGITPEEEAALWERQGGLCAICGTHLLGPGKRGTHLDHDHQTGRVRGFLCLSCNQGLGRFFDEPGLIEVALAYLLND